MNLMVRTNQKPVNIYTKYKGKYKNNTESHQAIREESKKREELQKQPKHNLKMTTKVYTYQ